MHAVAGVAGRWPPRKKTNVKRKSCSKSRGTIGSSQGEIWTMAAMWARWPWSTRHRSIRVRRSVFSMTLRRRLESWERVKRMYRRMPVTSSTAMILTTWRIRSKITCTLASRSQEWCSEVTQLKHRRLGTCHKAWHLPTLKRREPFIMLILHNALLPPNHQLLYRRKSCLLGRRKFKEILTTVGGRKSWTTAVVSPLQRPQPRSWTIEEPAWGATRTPSRQVCRKED